jgi:hypothetical protein
MSAFPVRAAGTAYVARALHADFAPAPTPVRRGGEDSSAASASAAAASAAAASAAATLAWLRRVMEEVRAGLRPDDGRLVWILAHGLAYAPDAVRRVDHALELGTLLQWNTLDESSPLARRSRGRQARKSHDLASEHVPEHPLASSSSATGTDSRRAPRTATEALHDLVGDFRLSPDRMRELVRLFALARPPPPFTADAARSLLFHARWNLPLPPALLAKHKHEPQVVAQALQDARQQRVRFVFARLPYRSQHRWANAAYAWARQTQVDAPDRRLLDSLLEAARARREWISVSFLLTWLDAVRAFIGDDYPPEYDWPSLGEFALGAVQEQLRRLQTPQAAAQEGLREPALAGFLRRHGPALDTHHALRIEWTRMQWQHEFLTGSGDGAAAAARAWSALSGREPPVLTPLPADTWTRVHAHDLEQARAWAAPRLSDGAPAAPVAFLPASVYADADADADEPRSDWVAAELAVIGREVGRWNQSGESAELAPFVPFVFTESAARALRAIAMYVPAGAHESQRAVEARVREWPASVPYTPSGAPKEQAWKHLWRRAVLAEHWPLLAYLTLPWSEPVARDDTQRELALVVCAAHVAAVAARGMLEKWLGQVAESKKKGTAQSKDGGKEKEKETDKTNPAARPARPPAFRELVTKLHAWSIEDWRRALGGVRVVPEWSGEEGLYRDTRPCTTWYLMSLQWLWSAWFLHRASDEWMRALADAVLAALSGYAGHAAKQGALQTAGAPDLWTQLSARTVPALWDETRRQLVRRTRAAPAWLQSCLHDLREWTATALASSELSSRRVLAVALLQK